MNIALCVGEEPKMEIPLTSICWFIVSFPSPCSYLIYFCSCRTLSTSVMERQIWEKNKNRVFSFENNGKVFSTLRMNYDSTFPVPSFEVHMELGMVCHQSASPNNLPLTSMPRIQFHTSKFGQPRVILIQIVNFEEETPLGNPGSEEERLFLQPIFDQKFVRAKGDYKLIQKKNINKTLPEAQRTQGIDSLT